MRQRLFISLEVASTTQQMCHWQLISFAPEFNELDQVGCSELYRLVYEKNKAHSVKNRLYLT